MKKKKKGRKEKEKKKKLPGNREHYTSDVSRFFGNNFYYEGLPFNMQCTSHTKCFKSQKNIKYQR